ncbi:D-xylose 1-dehydrogenase Gfo6 [Halopenitus sp. H-Gu1]|uniref:D-xylose 1-dehydrogenase Gfo6 n=1 Tax=Halopenitus sp. H-Gu1 TaxID=3242697 RepID=UPI00359EDDBE
MTEQIQDVFDEFTHRDWQTISEHEDAPVRFAVIGLGWFTRDWAIPGFKRGQFTEPTVTVSSSKEKAEEWADDFDMAAGITYEEFHDGAASDLYDAVYICTPNALHLEYARTAADLDKDVLCEKPMEVDAESAAEMVDVCRDVTLMVAYRMQTEPAVRRMRELIADGFIGDVVHVHGDMSQVMLGEIGLEEGGDVTQWRLKQDLSGGCALIDLGLYPLNTTRFILDADPVRVYAQTRSEHEAFEEVDEHASWHMEFPDGVTALNTVSQNSQHSSTLQIKGTEGQLILDPAFFEREDRGLRVVRGGTEADIDFDQVHQLEEEFDYFAHCLLTGEQPQSTGEHGLVDMQVVDAIYESADTGAPVDLDL